MLYEEYGLGLTPFSPLKAGILTGKYNDGIPKDSRFAVSDDGFVKYMQERFQTEEWQKEVKQVASLKPIADKLGVNQTRLAMAWVLKHPQVAVQSQVRVDQNKYTSQLEAWICCRN